MTAVIRTMAANLSTTMRCFGLALRDGCAHEVDGLMLVEAGPGLGLFNTAVLTAPVESEQEFATKTAIATRHFRHRDLNWCFWVCEGLLAAEMRPRLPGLLRARGMAAAAATPGMSAARLRPPTRALPEVAVHSVVSSAARSSFSHIITLAFDGPPKQIAAVYGSASFWDHNFRGFLGTVRGQDVCAGALVVADGAIGIYAVATLPGSTGQGYAEALLRQAIARALAQHGPLPLVLQSTAAALTLYRRLGFERVTNFSVFTS